ncbi:MAG: hypothetical protein QM765_26035 [Myxococcales bacterium]
MWPFVVAALLAAAPARPDADVPKTMTKVVVRPLAADLPSGSFAAQPKTYFRAGKGYGRVEEALDRELNLHVLIVVDEPKVWMINLATKSGRTITDPGPTFVFHANIVDRKKGEAAIFGLEFGLEPEFMKKHAASTSKVKVGKRELLEPDHDRGWLQGHAAQRARERNAPAAQGRARREAALRGRVPRIPPRPALRPKALHPAARHRADRSPLNRSPP